MKSISFSPICENLLRLADNILKHGNYLDYQQGNVSVMNKKIEVGCV